MENKKNTSSHRNEYLKIIYDDTFESITEFGSYVTNYGKEIPFKDKELVKGSRFFRNIFESKKTSEVAVSEESPIIYVQNIDSFDKAREMGEDCAVLNMASAVNPGGGVEKGSKAQEEELCRRSNLVKSLYHFDSRRYRSVGYKEKGFECYPMSPCSAIWSPKVMVFKESKTYLGLDKPYFCNVISVAAVRKPELTADGKYTSDSEELMRNKIRTIFRVAKMYKVEKLVLGAFGCGAFANPPKEVARLFKEVLDEIEFKNIFNEICFAIIEDENSKRNISGGNIKPFSEIFPLRKS